MNDVQRHDMTVLARAHNFMLMLEDDPELARLGVEPHMFLAVAMAGTVLPSIVAPGSWMMLITAS